MRFATGQANTWNSDEIHDMFLKLTSGMIKKTRGNDISRAGMRALVYGPCHGGERSSKTGRLGML